MFHHKKSADELLRQVIAMQEHTCLCTKQALESGMSINSEIYQEWARAHARLEAVRLELEAAMRDYLDILIDTSKATKQ
jgi:hypothetical protein